MTPELTRLVDQWKQATILANAFYSMYKDQRQRADSFESQLREAVQGKPLQDADWKKLRDKVEKNGDNR
jgi:hypothetical protein